MDRRKFVSLILVAVLVAAVPLTVFFAQQQQETRQQAADITTQGGASVSATLVPQSSTAIVGQPFSVDLFVKAGTNDITGVDITIGFNNAILPVDKFVPDTKFNSQLYNTIDQTNHTFRYAATNTNTTVQVTGDVRLGTLVLDPKALGQADLTFAATQITAFGINDPLTVSSAPLTIVVVAPSPTASPISPTPIPTATPTAVPTTVPSITLVPSLIPTVIPLTPTLIPTATPIPPTPTKPVLLGDANGDGAINILDYNIWRDEFLGNVTTKKSDFNNDGKIDLIDFNIWRNAFSGPRVTPIPISLTPTQRPPSPTPTPAKAITSFNPSSGVPGTRVTIVGYGFGAWYPYAGINKVTIGNAVAATLVGWNDTQIIVDVPTKAASGSIVVFPYTGGSITSSSPFTFITPTPTPIPPTASTPRFLKAFITSTSYAGNFGGLQGADNLCNARGISLGGSNFRAWLSDSTGRAWVRIQPRDTTLPYKLVNGTIIANNFTDLRSGNLKSPISITELGTVRSDYVWTNTTGSGEQSFPTQSCSNWTGTAFGKVGNSTYSDYRWTESGTVTCDTKLALYCFEQ